MCCSSVSLARARLGCLPLSLARTLGTSSQPKASTSSRSSSTMSCSMSKRLAVSLWSVHCCFFARQLVSGFPDRRLCGCELFWLVLKGSDTFRQYWSRYFKGSAGVIFLVDADGAVEQALSELNTLASDPQLRGLPLCVALTHRTDSPQPLPPTLQAAKDDGRLESHEAHVCTLNVTDAGSARQELQTFAAFFDKYITEETEPKS
eukprot:m.279748 g.279748  ORF g.279748 m.279748 type:complete len:205 (-) comp54908_c0_seq13:117-731(-)